MELGPRSHGMDGLLGPNSINGTIYGAWVCDSYQGSSLASYEEFQICGLGISLENIEEFGEAVRKVLSLQDPILRAIKVHESK